tara:strand:+ start:215 stop:805 length:591 start_codon:yes stop_codon:yes gene_type:complete
MSKKKTLWVFGDSFTKGLGLYPDEHQYPEYKGKENLIWSNLLANFLEANLESVAFNGISNDMIWDNIIDKWDDITTGDYVIIGLTKLPRWQIYSPGHKQVGLFNKTPIRDTQLLLNGEQVLQNIRDNMEDVYANVMTNFIFLTDRFHDKGCETFIWDTTLWTKFKTIYQETKHNDHHWGIQGNQEMVDYLKTEMRL